MFNKKTKVLLTKALNSIKLLLFEKNFKTSGKISRRYYKTYSQYILNRETIKMIFIRKFMFYSSFFII